MIHVSPYTTHNSPGQLYYVLYACLALFWFLFSKARMVTHTLNWLFYDSSSTNSINIYVGQTTMVTKSLLISRRLAHSLCFPAVFTFHFKPRTNHTGFKLF